MWLAYYVSSSRPRSFSRLPSHGVPDRVIDGTPPQSITDAFDMLLNAKIADTKQACVDARAAMGWQPGFA